MRKSLQRLVELQRVDTKLAEVESEAADIPGRREVARGEREAAQAALDTARERIETAELRRRECESTTADKEALVRRLEGQTAAVKTNEAYTALLHEIDEAKQAISDSETATLEAMDEIDAASSAVSAAERELAEVDARMKQELDRLDAREAELVKEREQLSEARGRVAETIEANLFARYEKILLRRQPAIAVVSGELCTGCRVGIPPQSVVNLIQCTEIIVCNSCQRLLIHERMIEGGDLA